MKHCWQSGGGERAHPLAMVTLVLAVSACGAASDTVRGSVAHPSPTAPIATPAPSDTGAATDPPVTFDTPAPGIPLTPDPGTIAFAPTVTLSDNGLTVKGMIVPNTIPTLGPCVRFWERSIAPDIAQRLARYEIRYEMPPYPAKITDLSDFAEYRGIPSSSLQSTIDSVGGLASGHPITLPGGGSAIVMAMLVDFARACSGNPSAIIAHEGGHLVMDFGMTQAQRSSVTECFARALDAAEFVTDYAHTNSQEYWAETSVAYFNEYWITGQRGHRSWVQQHDPCLFRILQATYPGA